MHANRFFFQEAHGQATRTSSVIMGEYMVGKNPYGVEVNPNTDRVYVANSGSGTVSVIDGLSGSTLTVIQLGGNPYGLAINPNSNTLYTTDLNSDSVSVIDGTKDRLVTTIQVGEFPVEVAVNTSTNTVYVANWDSDTVSVIEGSSNTVVNDIMVGRHPAAIAVNENTNKVYIANGGSDSVSVLNGDSNSIEDTISVGSNPFGITVNPNTSLIYVTNSASETVSVIDGSTNTLLTSIDVGEGPDGLAFDPNVSILFVANSGSGTVSVIDTVTNTVITSLDVGLGPDDIAVDTQTHTAYITNWDSGSISLISYPETTEPTAGAPKGGPIGKEAVEIAASEEESSLFSSELNSENILAMAETRKVLLDSDIISTIYDLQYEESMYQVVKYENLLPYASGVQVFSSNILIKDPNTVKGIANVIGWREAANQVTTSDLETLSGIFETSTKIKDAVTPVASITSSVAGQIDYLKNKCDRLILDKCAWDVVVTSFPAATEFEFTVRALDKELREWKDASSGASSDLPLVISGLEKLKAGNEPPIGLQKSIQSSLHSFSSLKEKTDRMVERLATAGEIIGKGEGYLRSKANYPVLGPHISSVAKLVAELHEKLRSLEGQARYLSQTLEEQSGQLRSVTTTAAVKAGEINNAWKARQNASTYVYGTIIGGIGMIGGIAGAAAVKSKRRRNRSEARP